MPNTSDDRRIANDRANKEAIAKEAEKSNDASVRREGERQTNEAQGIKAEQEHRAGRDPGKSRS